MILLDTTVLSNFARIARSDLLRLALPDAVTTPHVMAELAEGIALGRLPNCDWDWLEIITLALIEESHLARARLALNDGEASCIAVVMERGGVLFSDDRDARRYARWRGLQVSGTLGVLARLVKGGHLSVAEADACLGEMIICGYRSPVKSITDLRGSRP